MSIKQSEPLRYERKFLITDYTHTDVEQLIKYHPACFSEIFHERIINNIYFDTLGMSNYYDNIDGQSERVKVRIRWYGTLFGKIQSPVLEYKIKKGLLGKKNSFKMQPFTLDEHFSKNEISKGIETETIPLSVKNELLTLKPTLLNSYVRKYFLSADKKFRITIDHHLKYYKISYNDNTFLNKIIDTKATVLELKYDSVDEEKAKEVGALFPFMLTKNSKYLQGLESVFI